ncbi:hypothetical protein MOC55_11965 [Bacillus spizizenii]|uniref:Uncharacterized protein n=1 Tax=Bacillus spizizenii TaxID=96241 RepID=A0A9Q4DPL6_BACSC|nr:hypothetical protein [Bacillus subtilis]MCY8119577.1 hypothetical protein [Bacillus spizizenii]MUG00803.1 hypothetical protein [Bacillus tequilensis]MCY8155183.1 hypothetical protein [Bacillus spizizenii]MCY8196548.1 hypothetical protein [Bacillus spizizenii]MCY8219318.1 hypothetical protein [Bacillus spizizenii]
MSEMSFVDIQKSRVNLLTETLDKKVEGLVQDLVRVREYIADGTLDRINSSGEIQGRGQQVDLLCNQIRTILSTVEEFEAYQAIYRKELIKTEG